MALAVEGCFLIRNASQSLPSFYLYGKNSPTSSLRWSALPGFRIVAMQSYPALAAPTAIASPNPLEHPVIKTLFRRVCSPNLLSFATNTVGQITDKARKIDFLPEFTIRQRIFCINACKTPPNRYSCKVLRIVANWNLVSQAKGLAAGFMNQE